MGERICRGCPNAVPPATGRRPRGWCSGACRQRWLRANRPEMMAAIAERTYAKVRAAAEERREPCMFCGELRPGGLLTCGKVECQKALHALRAREVYHADVEAARLRVAKQREAWTSERVAEEKARQRERMRLLGYTPAKRAADTRRRTRIQGQTVDPFDPQMVFQRDRWKCGICRKKIDRELKYPDPMSVSLDHIVPVSLGGPHTPANTRASHLRCNLQRNAAPQEELQLVLM
jgi:5-methylcytosine-specific restriction endonuclease McrA